LIFIVCQGKIRSDSLPTKQRKSNGEEKWLPKTQTCGPSLISQDLGGRVLLQQQKSGKSSLGETEKRGRSVDLKGGKEVGVLEARIE